MEANRKNSVYSFGIWIALCLGMVVLGSCSFYTQTLFFYEAKTNFYEVSQINAQGQTISRHQVHFRYLETTNRASNLAYNFKYEYMITNLDIISPQLNWSVIHYDRSGIGSAERALNKTDYYASVKYFIVNDRAQRYQDLFEASEQRKSPDSPALQDTVLKNNTVKFLKIKENSLLRFGDKEYTSSEAIVTRQHGVVYLKLQERDGGYTSWRLML